MQYLINNDGIEPNELDRELIETKIGLSLSRFANIISKCEISFKEVPQQRAKALICCTIDIKTNAQTQFTVSDSASSISQSFPLALNRITRNIDRHNKRQNVTRGGIGLGNRLS